jgi:enoyl-CoA hydratase/carnithine racemase
LILTNIIKAVNALEIQTGVLIEEKNGIGKITLNRPQALNSLNAEMVKAVYNQLLEWKKDPDIALLLIEGEGEKGLCAGGDMRKFYDLKESGVKEYAEQFFGTEYPMDYEIHHYPKPVLVYMNGIVMGGGVGLSFGASYRIVTEKTKWAMPEMNIGFFPDVGASYFLNKMPGSIGRYLALTAAVIKAEDVLYAGGADFYLESEKWSPLKQAIEETNWTLHTAAEDLEKLLEEHCHSSIETSSLALNQEKINEHFQFESVEEIVASLKRSAENGDEWAEKTVNTILSKSPISLKVTLRQIQAGKNKSLHECLEMEMNLAMNFMTCDDFYEGVRSVLVDKDRNPKWNPAALEEVNEQTVEVFFNYKWENRQNLLANLAENNTFSR